MFKHILGQSVYQMIILVVLVFAGDQFLPEYSDKFDEEFFNPGSTFKPSDKYKEIGESLFIFKMIYILRWSNL